jgi:NitT/TauT family transport system substrate-binding protein
LLVGLWVALGSALAQAPAPQRFVFITNWFAQAEHGGFYQALASGLYRAEGLDVTLRMGGPQVNGMQLLAAGQADCIMGDHMQTYAAWAQGIQAVTVAAAFQKDPQVLIGHPGVLDKLDDLRGKTILVSPAANSTYWPWLKAKYGLEDRQNRPYTFNIQPFIADRNLVQQGYLSSEPYAIEKQAGFKPRVFLLADHGWPPYATTIVCMERTVRERAPQVQAFVRASMRGWKDYLQGNPAAANALIKRDNPEMKDDMLAVGIRLMNETGMVTGGDAARLGIGIVTDARMQETYELLVRMKLLDPAKVDNRRTYTTRFVRDLKVMP